MRFFRSVLPLSFFSLRLDALFIEGGDDELFEFRFKSSFKSLTVSFRILTVSVSS